MKKETLIKGITVEWDGGKVGGFNSREEAERFIECICKKIAPNQKYSIKMPLKLRLRGRV